MMFYTVYKTVNLINGKFYIGVHQTENPDDGYLGSGKYLLRAVAKYGPQGFKKKILFIFAGPKEAFDKERELVAAVLGNKLCMNMKHGGDGGYDYINRLDLNNHVENAKKATAARIQKIKSDPAFRKRWKEIAKIGAAKARLNPNFGSLESLERGRKTWLAVWTGQKHSEVSRKKMRANGNGSINQKWMCHPVLGVKRVVPDQLKTHLDDGWKFGRARLVHCKVRSS